MARLLPALALLAVLALPACGGGKATTAASSSPCPSGAVGVTMKDIRFAPQTTRLKVGQTVCWTNQDDVQHDAVADDGAFASSLFGHGSTFAWKATKAGVITYVCSVHPGMTGELDVAP